jgi:hypothetical protein
MASPDIADAVAVTFTAEVATLPTSDWRAAATTSCDANMIRSNRDWMSDGARASRFVAAPRLSGIARGRVIISRGFRSRDIWHAETRNPRKNLNQSVGHPHETLRLENQLGYPPPEAPDAAFFVHSAQ